MSVDRAGATLRFATFLAPNMLPVYRLLAARIGERLGRPVELVAGRSFDQFERGEADLGVICGLPYVWLAGRRLVPVEPLAAPVLAGDRYGGRPVYYSDVIVRRDSRVACLGELWGCSWAFNEPASHSGHTVTLYSLARMGARPGVPRAGGGGRLPPAGHPPGRRRRGRRGRDRLPGPGGGASRPSAARRPPPRGRRLRPSTIQPVVAASRLPDRLKDEVRELLVGLGDDPSARPALAHGFVDRFAAVDDDIRAMLATVEAAGWTSLAQTATGR